MQVCRTSPLVGVALTLVASCASPGNELERVAKDWCMTIRASQVLPVYPLSEDVRPGDVYIVPTTLREQVRIYEERGFLPLDQRVTRLKEIKYDEFYANGFFDTKFGGAIVPASSTNELEVPAPRAAFPSYNFEVSKSEGIKLALPIQGVPAGLGFMSASKARGSVSIRDAYTYGVDSETLIQKLEAWAEAREVQETLASVAQQIEEPIFLRVVTRVYLTNGVTVRLANLDTSGGGADFGVAPEIELLDLATQDPARAEAAAAAYSEVLEAISNPLASDGVGGSVRFVQASRRAVTMDETFERPLVIGYRGFDVQVSRAGLLSAPIPSFATLQGEFDAASELAVPTSNLLDTWIDEDGNYDLLVNWLAQKKSALKPSDLIYGGDNEELREEAVRELGVRP